MRLADDPPLGFTLRGCRSWGEGRPSRCITVITRVGEKSEDWKAIFPCPAAHDLRGAAGRPILARYGAGARAADGGQPFLYICDLVCLILNCCIEWPGPGRSIPLLAFVYGRFKMSKARFGNTAHLIIYSALMISLSADRGDLFTF